MDALLRETIVTTFGCRLIRLSRLQTIHRTIAATTARWLLDGDGGGEPRLQRQRHGSLMSLELPSNQYHLAGFLVAFPCENMRGHAVEEPTVVKITTAQRGSQQCVFKRFEVSTSRSLVGSSSSSRLPPCFQGQRRFRRLRSPPDGHASDFCWSEPAKPKDAHTRGSVLPAPPQPQVKTVGTRPPPWKVLISGQTGAIPGPT